LTRYRGNYEAFLVQSKAAEEQLSAAYKNQQREIARLQRFVDRFRAKNTKATQAQSKLKQIERMEKIEAPESAAATIGFRFPQPARSGQRVVSLREVHFAYGETPVYQGLDFEVERGQRMVLVGPNGAGKSTLLKLLAGVIEPQQGSRTQGFNVRTGYFSQYRTDILDEDRTVLEEALTTPQPVTEQSVRTVLGSFLFRGDDVFKRVRVLSGGEKSRLALVKLLLDPPNLMLLDEPTTHLDIPSTEALLEALRQFQGTILFISHDVFFIRSLADHVLHVRNGRLTPYPGGYDYYVEKTGRPPAEAGATAPGGDAESAVARAPKGTDKREQRRREAEERQKRSRQRQALAAEVHKLERAIHNLEQRQAELTRELEDPATYAQVERAAEITREFQATKRTLLPLTTEWEQAATRLAELDLAKGA
jgi:ATP-binding cassette subfamily F protein 3